MFLQTLSLDEAKIESHRMLIDELGTENLKSVSLIPKESLIDFLDYQFSNLCNVFNTEIISSEEFEHRYRCIVQKIQKHIHQNKSYHVSGS